MRFACALTFSYEDVARLVGAHDLHLRGGLVEGEAVLLHAADPDDGWLVHVVAVCLPRQVGDGGAAKKKKH